MAGTGLSAVLPRDEFGAVVQLSPARTALAVTYDTSVSAATDVTLNASTTVIEVTAITQGIFVRFAATASSSNFDAFVPAGATRTFVVPAGVTTVSFIEEAASAKLVLVER